MDNVVSYVDFETIINEQNKYQELEESIRMMNSHKTDAEIVWLKKENNRY